MLGGNQGSSLRETGDRTNQTSHIPHPSISFWIPLQLWMHANGHFTWSSPFRHVASVESVRKSSGSGHALPFGMKNQTAEGYDIVVSDTWAA